MARPCPSCGTRKNMHFIGHNAGFRQVMEADGLKTAGFREGEVIAEDLQKRIDLWPWHHVAKYWLQYPRWTRVPTPPQTITPARKEENND